MLGITINAYSGRENPSRILEDAEAKRLLRDLTRNRGSFGAYDSMSTRLGFRGLTIEFLEDGLARKYDLPPQIHLGTGSAPDESTAQALAGDLINGMVGKEGRKRQRSDPIIFTPKLAEQLIAEMTAMSEQKPDITVCDIRWSQGLRVPGSDYVWGHFALSSPPPPDAHRPLIEGYSCPF